MPLLVRCLCVKCNRCVTCCAIDGCLTQWITCILAESVGLQDLGLWLVVARLRLISAPVGPSAVSSLRRVRLEIPIPCSSVSTVAAAFLRRQGNNHKPHRTGLTDKEYFVFFVDCDVKVTSGCWFLRRRVVSHRCIRVTVAFPFCCHANAWGRHRRQSPRVSRDCLIFVAVAIIRRSLLPDQPASQQALGNKHSRLDNIIASLVYITKY